MEQTNATHVYASTFESFSLDHEALRSFFRNQRTYIADRATLAAVAVNVAKVINVDPDFIFTLLKLEVGYPTDYETYRTTMRGGANNAYVGVTQMYNDFWTDVRTHFKFSSELPAAKEDTSLEMQLVAPFLYVERYKQGLIRQRYPFSPAVVYAAHQQGGPSVGLNSFGHKPIAGKQSGPSVRVVNEVKKFNRTKRPMAPVWL